MKKLLMTTAALAALCAGPLSTSSTSSLDHWSFVSVAEAGNGHGGGNGNAGGNGNQGNSANAGNSDRGNAQGNSRNQPNGAAPDNAGQGKFDNGKAQDSDILATDISKEKNLHAVLGRINSIGRNVNGIMNSKDPHIAGIRTYILNSVELAKAQTSADASQAAYDAALADYTDAGLSGDPAQTLVSLTSALAGADTETTSSLYAEIDITKALIDAQNTLTAAEARVAQYSVLASDAVLTDALASMSNRNLTSADISAATLEWSKAVLGVGDATGAIDAYMADTQSSY